MTVREDAVQTVVAIALKEADAAVVVTPHPAIRILTDQTAMAAVREEMEEAVQAQTEDPVLQAASLESSGKTDPTTASRKLLVMMAVQTIAAVQIVEAKAADVLITDKVTEEEMIGQFVKASVATTLVEAPQDQIDQNVKKDVQNNAVEERLIRAIKGVILAQNLKKPCSNPTSQARPVGLLEASLDLVKMNNINFGLRIAPL